jgi:uncharacterized protein
MMSGAMASRLERVLDGFARLAVAVSGGVDSLTLAAVAGRRLGGRMELFHAASAAVPPEATARVRALAAARGWRLRVIDAGELADPHYRANPVDRCWFCKMDLYGAIRQHSDAPLASGANLDDLADWRPGLRAAERHGVRHPLIEAGLDKAAVRRLAAAEGLGAVAELPASPCLASRIETGIPVTTECLALVLAAERHLQRILPGATLRCRIRRDGLVVEIEAARLAEIDRQNVAAAVRGIAQEHGLDAAVAVEAYRRGSAFRHDRRQPARS